MLIESWMAPIGVAAALAALAGVAHWFGQRVLLRLSANMPLLHATLRRAKAPLSFLLPLIATQFVWQGVDDEWVAIDAVRHLNGVLVIAATTWLIANASSGFADGIVALHPADLADNVHARRVHTQARVLSRIASGAVIVTGLAFILMTFPRARHLGASLLASAGVAGLVVGIAARTVFGNLLAGLQIALAQPIRIDDVLIVDGEWGRVEEITTTYVVLKIWDQRRLIVPLQWFIEHPFQNWTRSESALLGTVFLCVDYTLPVQAVRREAQRLCESQPSWDRRVCAVQVTDASEHGMQLRVLVSAASAGELFDLRCAVREGLIDFIQREYPQSLPMTRTALPPATGRAISAERHEESIAPASTGTSHVRHSGSGRKP